MLLNHFHGYNILPFIFSILNQFEVARNIQWIFKMMS